ncbi:hypothetical protein HDU92_003593, partial [Lobulomyces angularis]
MPFPFFDNESVSRLYPANLQLKKLILFHRHGERTPVDAERKPWKMCFLSPQLHNFYVAAEKFTGKDHSPESPASEGSSTKYSNSNISNLLNFSGVIFEGNDSKVKNLKALNFFDNFADNGSCLTGQLTDIGKLSMQKLGGNLRNLYVDQLHFIRGELDDKTKNNVYVRSTDYARTIESVQYLLNGFFPNQYRVEKNWSLPIHIKSEETETLYPSDASKIAVDLSKAFKVRVRKELQPAIDDIVLRMKKIGINVAPRMNKLHHLNDYFLCMKGNGVQLPPDVTDSDLEDLERICVKDWWEKYQVDPLLCKYSISGLMKDLKSDLLETDRKSKVSIYSGHDSTLGPLLSAFQAFDSKIPPFSSIINIEVFEEKKTMFNFFKNNSYVRLLYNGKVVKIPHCQDNSRNLNGDGSFCKINSFLEAVEKMIPSKQDEENDAKVVDVEQ